MVQKYRSEYGGRNLRGFCLEQKVSYQKMLHCLRRESYRNTQQAEEEAVLEQGLHPLEVELPANATVTETQKWKPARKRLRIYIKSQLHRDPTNGDIYIFLSWDSHRTAVIADTSSLSLLKKSFLPSKYDYRLEMCNACQTRLGRLRKMCLQK